MMLRACLLILMLTTGVPLTLFALMLPTSVPEEGPRHGRIRFGRSLPLEGIHFNRQRPRAYGT